MISNADQECASSVGPEPGVPAMEHTGQYTTPARLPRRSNGRRVPAAFHLPRSCTERRPGVVASQVRTVVNSTQIIRLAADQCLFALSQAPVVSQAASRLCTDTELPLYFNGRQGSCFGARGGRDLLLHVSEVGENMPFRVRRSSCGSSRGQGFICLCGGRLLLFFTEPECSSGYAGDVDMRGLVGRSV